MHTLFPHVHLNFFFKVKYIWMSRWSLGKSLYMLSRYLAFVDLTLLLVCEWHSIHGHFDDGLPVI